MAKGTAFATELLELILNGVAIAGLAQNHASPVTLDVALHTGIVAVGDAQTVNECNYTGYTRMTVVRDGSGWTVTAGSAVNATVFTGTENTGASQTATYATVGAAGSNTVLYVGQISPSFIIGTGVTPNFPAGQITITEA